MQITDALLLDQKIGQTSSDYQIQTLVDCLGDQVTVTIYWLLVSSPYYNVNHKRVV